MITGFGKLCGRTRDVEMGKGVKKGLIEWKFGSFSEKRGGGTMVRVKYKGTREHVGNPFEKKKEKTNRQKA